MLRVDGPKDQLDLGKVLYCWFCASIVGKRLAFTVRAGLYGSSGELNA